jgi:DNA repair protein RadA/Sms
MESRLKEAAKLGFGRALAPNGAGDSLPVTGVSRLAEAIDRIGQQRWTTP